MAKVEESVLIRSKQKQKQIKETIKVCRGMIARIKRIEKSLK